MVLNIAFDFLASVEAIGSATAEHTISAGQSPCKKKGVASVSALSGECHIRMSELRLQVRVGPSTIPTSTFVAAAFVSLHLASEVPSSSDGTQHCIRLSSKC